MDSNSTHGGEAPTGGPSQYVTKAPERTPLPNPSPKNPGRIGETQEGANKISL
jgi:hypothetical protein